MYNDRDEQPGHQWGNWDAEEDALAVSPGDFYAATQDIFNQVPQQISNKDLHQWLRDTDESITAIPGNLSRASVYTIGIGSSSGGTIDQTKAANAADALDDILEDLYSDQYDFPDMYRDHANYRRALHTFTAEPEAQKFAPSSLGPPPTSDNAEVLADVETCAEEYPTVELLAYRHETADGEAGDLQGTMHTKIPLDTLTWKLGDDVKQTLNSCYQEGYIGMHPRDKSPHVSDAERHVYLRTE